MKTFEIHILEADSPFYEGPCEMIIVPTTDGLVKVEDGEVLILAESIERPEEIDANRAKREADEAREAMLQQRSIREFKMAELELARTANRLRVKRHITGQ